MKFVPGFTDIWLSPVTGQIGLVSFPDLQRYYIWTGGPGNRAFPSPIIKDIRLEIRNLRFNLADTKFVVQTASDIIPEAQALDQLEDGMLKHVGGIVDIVSLTHNKIWVGDENDRPVESDLIPFSALPDLTEHNVWTGDPTNRPVEVQRLNNLNLPSFLNIDPRTNFGIYNLYTAGTVNLFSPISDPGPVASTTLRIDMSNMPNLSKGKMWMGVINYTPPLISIDTTFPYFHVTGTLNWDIQGFSSNAHAVPQEVGLDPGTIFIGDFNAPGEITTRGLNEGHFFIGNSGDRIISTGLFANQMFVGTEEEKIVKLTFSIKQMLYCDDTGSLVAEGLNAYQLWGGDPNDSGEIIKIIVLDISNLPNLTENKIWKGDGSNRPIEADITWAPNDATYKLKTAHPDLPNAQALDVLTPGIGIIDNAGMFLTRSIVQGTGITVLNGNGIAGNPTISITNTGVVAGTYRFLTGTFNAQGQATSLSDNQATIDTIQNDINTLQNATYVIRTSNLSLPNAHVTSAVGIGITKLIANGFFAIAVGGTDYATPAQITNLQTQIDSINSQITTINSQISTLQGQVSTLQGQVTVLEGAVAVLQGEVAALGAAVAALQGQVAALQSQITALSSTVAALGVTVAALGVTVTGLGVSLGVVIGDVNNLKDVKYIVKEAHAGVPNALALNTIGEGTLSVTPDGSVHVDENLFGLTNFTGTGIIVRQAFGVWTGRTIEVGSGLSISNADGVGGNPSINLDVDLQGLAGLSGSGLLVRIGSGNFTEVQINGGTGISVANSDGTGGDPTISIANTGVTAGSYTYASFTVNAQGQLTAANSNAPVLSVTGTANQITIAGTAVNPIISLADNAIFPGIEGITVPNGTTAQRPSSPHIGQIRLNTTTNRLEAYY